MEPESKEEKKQSKDEATSVENSKKRRRKIVVRPPNSRKDGQKTNALSVGMKLALFWEPTQTWSQAEIKWNWGDGSYVIQCEDDEDCAQPLTYYIDEYKIRYDEHDLCASDAQALCPPAKKRKLSKESRPEQKKKATTAKVKTKVKAKKEEKPSSKKRTAASKKKKEKPEKAKVLYRKVRSKKRPKTSKKATVRKPPTARARVEKLTQDESDCIDDVQDSFYDFDDEVGTSFGLRRTSLETFRAVNVSNDKLLKNAFVDKQNVCDPLITWSVHVELNCLDYAIRKQNFNLCQMLLRLKRKTKYAHSRVCMPNYAARLKVSSGFVGAATFGHRVRKVKASRGAKEGNNAFVYDETTPTRSMQDHFELALQVGNYDIIELFLKELHRHGLPRPLEQIAEGILYKAAQYGHLGVVRALIEKLASNHGGGDWGLNDLHKAVVQAEYADLGEFRNVSVTKKMLEGNFAVTPLHLACINGSNVAYLQQLVEQSGIVDHPDDLRRTPIFFAAACSSPGPLKYLIAKGAKMDATALVSKDNAEDEITPLLIAVKYGKAHNIPYLLGKPVDDNGGEDGGDAVDADADPAVAAAVAAAEAQRRHQYREVANQSLDARTNKRFLHVAAYFGHAEVVATLLEYGANPKAIMKGSRASAMHLAAKFGHLEVCRALLEHSCAQKNKRALLLKDNHKRTPLVYAVMNGHLELVQYLLMQGAPAYAADSSENTCIHYAAAYGWNDVLHCLMQAPFANPGAFNMWKLNAFFLAMLKGHDLCASTLLETKDFDVNAVDSDGKSILHYMLEHKNLNARQRLAQLQRIVLELGANVNVRMPRNRQTPLHTLAHHEEHCALDADMARVLMSKGARPDYQDAEGHTPLSMALQHSNFALVEAMITAFDVNVAAAPQPPIDWRAKEREERRRRQQGLALPEEEDENGGAAAAVAMEAEQKQTTGDLQLHTCDRQQWQTPLMIAIQLVPPIKPPPKPKENRRDKKRKQQQTQARKRMKLELQHGANVGGFYGATFHQNIGFAMGGDEDEDSSSSDSEMEALEAERLRREEEALDAERNQVGETTKQRTFRGNRLRVIKLMCGKLQSVEQGKYLNAFDKQNRNALIYAAQTTCYQDSIDGYAANTGSLEIIAALVSEFGCDANVMNMTTAETAISFVLCYPPTQILSILPVMIRNVDVNKRLVIYHKKRKKKSNDEDDAYDDDAEAEDDDAEDVEEDEDADADVAMSDEKDDKEKKRKIKVRRDSYLTTAIQRFPFAYESKQGVVDYTADPRLSRKFKVIKFLIECGARLVAEKETPAMIQIVAYCCAPDTMFGVDRFCSKAVDQIGSADTNIGYQLLCLILRDAALDIDLNITDSISTSSSERGGKSLLSYVIDLIATECRSRDMAMNHVLTTAQNTYQSRRDERIVAYKKRKYRARILSIPLISVRILSTLLSCAQCKLCVDEKSVLECMRLPMLQSTLRAHDCVTSMEPISLQICGMLLTRGQVDLNRHGVYNPLIEVLDIDDVSVRLKLIELLVAHRLDVNRQDSRGTTLEHAIGKDDHESVALLVRHGLNVNNCGWRERSGADSDAPNKLKKHPLRHLIEIGCGGRADSRHRAPILHCMLSQSAVQVTLQNEYCATMSKHDRLCIATVAMQQQQQQKWIEVEFLAYSDKVEKDKDKGSEHKKTQLNKTWMADNLAVWAYRSAYELYKKHYKQQSMEKRFSSPLWKQAIEILINCRWSLSRAKTLFSDFRQRLLVAIGHENQRRKQIRDKYKEQSRFLKKLNKHKHKQQQQQQQKQQQPKSDADDEEEEDAEDEDSKSVSSLESEERNAINSDDEMKKMHDIESELADHIDAEGIKEADLSPLVEVLCRHSLKYSRAEYDELVHRWFFAHNSLMVSDAAWQLCREQARFDETQRRRTEAIDAEKKRVEHLRQLRQQMCKTESMKHYFLEFVRDQKCIPDFSILDQRDREIERRRKEMTHYEEPPFIGQKELAKIVGVDCTHKSGSAEIRASFKEEIVTLRFAQCSQSKHEYECLATQLLKALKPEQLYYCIVHKAKTATDEEDREQDATSVKSRSLGYLRIIDDIRRVRHKETPVCMDIVRHYDANKHDALALLKVYHECGGDVSTMRDQRGQTPLFYAIRNNHLELIEWLLTTVQAKLDVRGTAAGNNILHMVAQQIETQHSSRSLNLRQLLRTVVQHIPRSKRDKEKMLASLSAQYNEEGMTPLLLAIKHVIAVFCKKRLDTAHTGLYTDYFAQQKADIAHREQCTQREEARLKVIEDNKQKWHAAHPVDYTEVDLDEMDVRIVSAEWRISPKPPPKPKPQQQQQGQQLQSIDPETGLPTTIDYNLLLSSQPVMESMDEDDDDEDEEDDEDVDVAKEDEEKQIILADNDDDEDDQQDKDKAMQQEQEEDDRGTPPAPMDVTGKVRQLVSAGHSLHIDCSTDLHQLFLTEDWDDRKWTLEITYAVGDYMRTVSTEQNEAPDDTDPYGNQYQSNNNFGGGFGFGFGGGYQQQQQYQNKLTSAVAIPGARDRVKQVYHYRMTQLLRTHGETTALVLDHLDVKNDGAEHDLYVFLCRQLGETPQFAYPVPLRKQKKKKTGPFGPFAAAAADESAAAMCVDYDSDDNASATGPSSVYTFAVNKAYESESDCELPPEPEAVVHARKPVHTEQYSLIDFLREFIESLRCNVDAQMKASAKYLEKMEKQAHELQLKYDHALMRMSAHEREAYFSKLTKHRLRAWSVNAPWLRHHKKDTEWVGFSALHFAAYHTDANLIKLFVSQKIDPNLVTVDSRRSALMIFCEKSNDASVLREMLSDKRCKVNMCDVDGFTALIFAVNFSARRLHDSERSFRETFQMERLLLRGGADINHIDVYGRSALHYIFVPLEKMRCMGTRDPIELVSDITSAGHKNKKVNVEVVDFLGRTPVSYAGMLGAQISSNWLTKEGANIHGQADHDGNEPFQHALLNAQKSLAVDYINQNVDVKHMLYHYHTHRAQSSFRHVLELKWMGVAYLMVSRGVEITLAVQDALETQNYQLAKTLLYKTACANLQKQTKTHARTLHHIVASYRPPNAEAKKAFNDPWSLRIVEILDESNVPSRDLKDAQQMTCLSYAVRTGHVNLSKHYIVNSQMNAEVADIAPHRERPLVVALYNRDTPMVQMLVHEIGVNVKKAIGSAPAQRKDGNVYPLHVATTVGAPLEVCRWLLNRGATTSVPYDQKCHLAQYHNRDRMVIHTAVRKRNYDLAKLFLENGADVNCKVFGAMDLCGYVSCFHLALNSKHTLHDAKRLMELLLLHKCDVNARLNYLTAIAPLDESSPVAKQRDLPRWKREYRQVHELDGLDQSALHIVCRRWNQFELSKFLIGEHQANVNEPYRKELLLMRAQKQLKLKHEFHIDTTTDLPDLCLLHTHVRQQSAHMVELLIDARADVNVAMCRETEHAFGECFALHTAVRLDHTQIADLLLIARANPNALYTSAKCKNSDLSALHTAIRHQNEDMVRLLLKAGANANETMIAENSEFGELTGLHMAVKHGNVNIAQQLLKHGANPNHAFYSKRTVFGDAVPIHMAIRHNHYELVNLLLLYGADPNVRLQPKPKKQIIWKWTSDAGWKEYDARLSLLIERQYQAYVEATKEKQEHLKQLQEANINLTVKKKPNANTVKALDDKIKHASVFHLRHGAFFEAHTGYLLDFACYQQRHEAHQTTSQRRRRNVQRYQHPVDCHSEGGSSLWMAVREQNYHIVSLLVNYHCDMNVVNRGSHTPLIYAIQQNELTMAAILVRGAVFYHAAQKEKILRGIERRLQYARDSDSGDDNKTGQAQTAAAGAVGLHYKTRTNHRKRSRADTQSTIASDLNESPHKKRKNEAAAASKDEIVFVPIDVNLADKLHGFGAVHHCIHTDGVFNASFENETMLKLVVSGQTMRTQHFLENKVDLQTPFQRELAEQEQKDTDFSKPQKFKARECTADINMECKRGHPPIYYALLQKSNKMAQCLQHLGARVSAGIKRNAQEAVQAKLSAERTEKENALKELYGESMLGARYDVLQDARLWRKHFFVDEDDEDEEEDAPVEKVEVDTPAKAELGKKAHVLTQGKDAFDWDGLYVNVDKGKWGAIMFYKMQLLYQPIQKLTILWCRWGRPGEVGNYQRSPYQDQDKAIREFKKIFLAKTVNEWQNRGREKFVPQKWRIVRKKRRRLDTKVSDKKTTPHNLVNSMKEILRSLPKEQRPKSVLPTDVCEFLYTIFDVAAFTQSRRRLELNTDAERLGYLEDEDLDKCYELIQQLSVLVKEQEQEDAKRHALQQQRWKVEKQKRERNTKRQRNQTLFERTQQRNGQEMDKLHAMLRSLRNDVQQLEQKQLDASGKRAEIAESEQAIKDKQSAMDEDRTREDERVSKERAEFDPMDEKATAEMQRIDEELLACGKTSEDRRKKIVHLSNEFYLLMPRDEFANTYITAIDNSSLCHRYLNIMMCLSEHQIALKALMAAQHRYLQSKLHPIDYCFISLKCKMLPLRAESYAFKLILSFMNRTASPTILDNNVKMFEIWKESEEKTFGKFADYDNRMLLWHGSDTANAAGILTKGLRIAPPESDATGYMFGKGIYFADAFQKSRNYSSAGNGRNAANTKCVLLCSVALGSMYEAINAEYLEESKAGFQSTKGLGRRGPNPSNIKTTFDGEIIADSDPIEYPQRTTRDKENNIINVPFMLNWNEYVIYNEQQAKLKYLILLQ